MVLPFRFLKHIMDSKEQKKQDRFEADMKKMRRLVWDKRIVREKTESYISEYVGEVTAFRN